MNLEIYATSKTVEALGWTPLHSIWQVDLTAFVLFLLLRIL
ncbi:MAG: hypothetical protein ACR2N3_10065 [Pyrinomonadaceae bacterium]